MKLIAPNGCEVEASEESAPNLLSQGWRRPDGPEEQPKPKAARKRAAAKTKE